MRPFSIMRMRKAASAVITWADINGGSGSTSNANQTMTGTGTLNISDNIVGNGTFTKAVFLNGVSQGWPASISVVPGDLVHFTMTMTGVSANERSGTVTITGLVSSSFFVDCIVP